MSFKDKVLRVLTKTKTKSNMQTNKKQKTKDKLCVEVNKLDKNGESQIFFVKLKKEC